MPALRRNAFPVPLEDLCEFPVSPRYLEHRVFPPDLLSAPVNERIPEGRPAHRETDKSRNAGRSPEPLVYFGVIFSSAQDDAANFVTAFATRGGHDALAILTTVETLDLPHIRLHARILEFPDRADHKFRPKLHVVDLPVAV